jgi:hypothetical protein
MLKSVDSQCFTKLAKLILYTSEGLLSVIFAIFAILGWVLNAQLHNYFKCERPLCFRSRRFLNDLNAHSAPASRLGFRLAEWASPHCKIKAVNIMSITFQAFVKSLPLDFSFEGCTLT